MRALYIYLLLFVFHKKCTATRREKSKHVKNYAKHKELPNDKPMAYGHAPLNIWHSQNNKRN